MEIVCVGCSLTYGVVDNQKDFKHTYPYFLYESLENCTVYNLGMSCFSNFWIYKMMKDAIEKLNPDLIIRQITTPYRYGVYDVNKKWNLRNYTSRLEGNYQRHYTLLDENSLHKDSHLWSPSRAIGELYDDKTKNKIHEDFYKFTCNDVMLEMNEAVLLAGDKLLENKKSLTFSWFANDSRADCPSVEEEIGFHERYLCDSTGHFNAEGNKKVSEWVRKNIREII